MTPPTSSVRLVLVLGGTASGKSAFAERYAAALGGPVCYVATAVPRDAEMRRRIARHRARRPRAWRTVEAPRAVGRALAALPLVRTIVLESLGMLVANHLGPARRRPPPSPALRRALAVELAGLTRACRRSRATVVLVSEEVGLSLVPASTPGRAFTDALGWLNQQVAARADEVYLVVAGTPIPLKGAGGGFQTLARRVRRC